MPVVFRYKGIRLSSTQTKAIRENRRISTRKAAKARPSSGCVPRSSLPGAAALLGSNCRKMVEVVKLHRDEIERAWNEHFS